MTARHFETVLTASTLSGSARMVLAVIAYAAGLDGRCTLPLRQIADLTGLSKSAVDQHVAAAVEANELAVSSSAAARGKPRVYTVLLGNDGAICPAVEPDYSDVDKEAIKDAIRARGPGPVIVAPERPAAVALSDGLPASDVGRVLRAAGVRPPDDEPLYWHRAAHKADLGALTARMGSLDALIEHVAANPPKEAIRRLTQLVRAR